MPRIMITCPSGRGSVPTGYRTADVDLTMRSHTRAFRCSCGQIHTWSEEAAWAEQGLTVIARGDARAPLIFAGGVHGRPGR